MTIRAAVILTSGSAKISFWHSLRVGSDWQIDSRLRLCQNFILALPPGRFGFDHDNPDGGDSRLRLCQNFILALLPPGFANPAGAVREPDFSLSFQKADHIRSLRSGHVGHNQCEPRLLSH